MTAFGDVTVSLCDIAVSERAVAEAELSVRNDALMFYMSASYFSYYLLKTPQK